jgi:hypothetical protein
MPKRTNTMQSGGYQIGRLVDQSGGMVDSTVYPTLLNDNEAASLKNCSLDEKGTVKPCKGRSERFASAFDASNACNGIGAFYPDTATSRLVMGAGTKLYKDTPHLINRWTDQADWQETGAHRCNADTTTTAGDVKVLAAPAATFARSGVKRKKDGTSVADGTPSYETGKFSNGIHIDESATNVMLQSQDLGTTWTAVGTSVVSTNTTEAPDGTTTADTLTDNDASGLEYVSQAVTIANDSTWWTTSVFIKKDTDETRFPAFGLWLTGGTSEVKITAQLNTKTGATAARTSQGTVLIHTPVEIDGYWRFSISAQNNSTGNTTATIYLVPADGTVFGTSSNAATGSAIFWQVDLINKAYPVSPIVTTTGTVSKNADSLYYTLGAAMPNEWFISGFWKPDQASTLSRTNNVVLATIQYDGNNEYIIRYAPSGDTFAFYKIHGGTAVILSSVAVTFAAGDVMAFAAAQLTQAYGDLAAGMHLWYRINSGSVVHVSNADTNLPTAPAKAYMGCYSITGYEANGVIDAVKLVDAKAELANGTTINNTWTEAFLTAVSAPTSTPATLLLAQFNDVTTATATSGFVWISANKDISGATDTGSGKVEYANTAPGSSSMAFKTRTSTDGTTWDAWTAVDGSGNIGSTHHNYIQLAIVGTVSGSDSPSVQSSTLSYDNTPAAVELATGFTAGGQFYFATLLAYLVIVNKLDAPRKWDGTAAVSTLGGSPPHGQYVAAHKNYLFQAHTTANPSRLHFSDIINLESWSALNFIDISPNDGDWITGLLPFDDYLIITKQRSVWALVGDGTSDFAVKRIHSGIGCIAPRSLVRMGELFGFAYTEGFYLSDITKPTLITERLKDTWDALNKRRLNQIASEFFDHKLRIDVPNGASTTNNLRIVYDSIRKALLLEEMDNHASCYTKYTEAGQEVLLYGHSTEGQVSQADTGTTDGGAAIDFEWKTKHFNFGSSATEKKVRNTYIAAVPAASDVTLTVYFIVDNVEVGTPISVTVTGSANEDVKTYKLKPRDVGIRKVRTLGYRVVQSTTNGGVKIHELLQEYMTKKIKAS